jgi:hypothetical protein
MNKRLATYCPLRHCLRCDYDLRGSAASCRCPECGWQFHESTIVLDAWGFRNWPRLWSLPVYLILIACCLFVLGIVLAAPIRTTWARWFLAGMAGAVLAHTGRKLRDLALRHRKRAPERLVMYRRSVGLHRHDDPRGTSFRWRDVDQYRIQRLRSDAWRVRFKVGGWTVIDGVVNAQRRTAATLNAEIKRRIRAAQAVAKNRQATNEERGA